MGKEHLERKLKQALNQLNAATENILKSRGYVKDVKTIKVLSELMKEQISSEDFSSSARKAG